MTLKRCPFCGGAVKIRWTRHEPFRYEVVHAAPTDKCPMYKTWLYNTEEEAKEKWNTRYEKD